MNTFDKAFRRTLLSAHVWKAATFTLPLILFSSYASSRWLGLTLQRNVINENSDRHPFATMFSTDKEPFSVRDCLHKNGFAYGPFRDGQAPSGPGELFPFPTIDQIEEDIDALSKVTSNIRVYGSSGDYSQIAELAKSHKPALGVMQGIDLHWNPKMSRKQNQDENQKEIDSAVKLAKQGFVDSVIVGNETFSHSASVSHSAPMPKEELLLYIRAVKKELDPLHIPVSTAQVYSDWESNLDMAGSVNFVVAHFYPFWDVKPVPVEQAAASLLENYNRLKADLKAKYGRDIEVVIGETGWPSGGEPNGKAIPSPENQRRFLEEFTRIAYSNSIRFYYFSAFDEEWKWEEGGNTEWMQRHNNHSRRNSELPLDRMLSGNWIGSSWGIFQSNGMLKPTLKDLLQQPQVGSRVNRDIFLGDIGRLSTHYDMGVDSDPDHLHDWLHSSNNELSMHYPTGQHVGSVFITVGNPKPSNRPWKDFSAFKTLSIEMRGEKGGEKVEIGIKNRGDQDNGHETRVAQRLTAEYHTYHFPLTEFASEQHLKLPQDLKQLYTIVEFVFQGPKPQPIYVKNIRYEP